MSLKTPDLVSSIRAAIYIQEIKTFDMYIITADGHPTQRRIISPKLSVYHQTIVCSMYYNEFIKLSMGMPTSARS